MTKYVAVRAIGTGDKPKHYAQIVEREYMIDGLLVTGDVAVTLCNKAFFIWFDASDMHDNYTNGTPFMHDCPTCRRAYPG